LNTSSLSERLLYPPREEVYERRAAARDIKLRQ
jgi:hypothetical protein